jgi:hypothetical protein
MAVDLTVYLADEPGELSRVTALLGAAGVNIEGCCATTSGGGEGEVHLLVEDETAAFEALEKAGIGVTSEQEVLVVPVEDRPGVLGDVARRLGDAGVNVTLVYLATDTRLVFACDDLSTARGVLQV